MDQPQQKRALGMGIGLAVLGLLSAGAMWAPRSGGSRVASEAGASGAAELPAAHWVANRQWDLPVTYNDRVGYWIRFLRGPNADRTRVWLERLGRYGPLIRQELRRRGMPEDLVYLAFIESGMTPRARSPAAALGLWQFVAGTAERYGLRVGPYVDERRDPIEETSAALDYLQDLHEQFGSWYLAAAAYNSGENRVERALQTEVEGARGDESLFWQIDDELPRETRDYVPFMLAAAYIAKDPQRYGFGAVEYESPLAFDTVLVPGGVGLDVVAQASEVPDSAVTQLNPQLIRGMTPPGRPSEVRIPVGSAEPFAQNFERVYAEQSASSRVRLVAYRVRPGETLSGIARRHGVDVAVLRSVNGGVLPRRLSVGQVIEVPVVAGEQAKRSLAEARSRRDRAWRTYRVRNGDSLRSIARTNGVTVQNLVTWNQLGAPDQLQPGESLKIRR
jgi:peptidoglycan lytic transglycosylase D